MQRGWNEILVELAQEFGKPELSTKIASKPLSMFIEELCAVSEGEFRSTELKIKDSFAKLLRQIEPTAIHRDLTRVFKVILTTNYDFTIEEALNGPLHSSSSLAPESRYSIFRRRIAKSTQVWHIHGDIGNPSSILLGYDHYAGYLQKIRNYVTESIKVAKVPYRLKSPVKSGILNFEESRKVYSWIDHFLRDHVHVVGFGLDFTEIDIWWLLLHKRRRRNKTGKVFFYHIELDGNVSGESPTLSLLRSLGVEVIIIAAPSYEKGYLEVLSAVKASIQKFPQLMPVTDKEFYVQSENSVPPLSSGITHQELFKFDRRRKARSLR
jgi:hypothetical protein